MLHRQTFVRFVHGHWDGAHVLWVDVGPLSLAEQYRLEGVVFVVSAVCRCPGRVYVVPEWNAISWIVDMADIADATTLGYSLWLVDAHIVSDNYECGDGGRRCR